MQGRLFHEVIDKRGQNKICTIPYDSALIQCGLIIG